MPLPSLPGFRLHSLIGSGPSGQVFRAHDLGRGREVAVKLLEPRRCGAGGLERLAAIAALAATSPVAREDQLYEVVPLAEQPFIVMDLLPGESLQRMLLRTGPMPWPKVRAIAHAIAVALEAAHDVGAIHGAVKPTNIFFHHSLVILTDFGIRSLPEPRDRDALLADAGRMAPEQLRGEPADVRTDVHGLGLVMYELATGRLPFTGRAHEVFQHQLRRPPPPASSFAPGLSPAADALLHDLLDRHPEQRPPTASRLRGLLSAPERAPERPQSMAQRMSWRRVGPRPPESAPIVEPTAGAALAAVASPPPAPVALTTAAHANDSLAAGAVTPDSPADPAADSLEGSLAPVAPLGVFAHPTQFFIATVIGGALLGTLAWTCL